jgi:hypothetical protein
MITFYLAGVFLSLVVLGGLCASVALTGRVTLAQGMVLFNTPGTAGGQLLLAMIWPLILSYCFYYFIFLHYAVFMHNRKMKNTIQTPIEIEPEEPTPVTAPTIIYPPGVN